MTKSVDHYLRLNSQSYNGLIAALTADLPAADVEVKSARENYFRIAIAKGVDFAMLPPDFADFDADELIKAADALPNKEAAGWTGTASITKENREEFAEAGYERPHKRRWDNLFGSGKTASDDLVLDFSEDAESSDNKIQKYIERYNTQAQINLRNARHC